MRKSLINSFSEAVTGIDGQYTSLFQKQKQKGHKPGDSGNVVGMAHARK